MKRDQSSVAKRRSDMLKIIREREEVKVEDLAKQFAISTMSVRRDLQYLEDRKLITRFYGGAAVNHEYRRATPGEALKVIHRLLGQYAASKVGDGETIFINGSMAALGLVDHLTARNVHVITNNAMAATRKYPEGVTVTLTGGDLRGHIMTGDSALRVLLDTTADKTFLGCAGITAQGEFSYNVPGEISINETMLARTAREIYIVADHTKLESLNTGSARYGSCIYDRQITLITDDKADPEVVEKLRGLGIEVNTVGIHDMYF